MHGFEARHAQNRVELEETRRLLLQMADDMKSRRLSRATQMEAPDSDSDYWREARQGLDQHEEMRQSGYYDQETVRRAVANINRGGGLQPVIEALAGQPAIVDVLNNPDIQRALTSGEDPNSLRRRMFELLARSGHARAQYGSTIDTIVGAVLPTPAGAPIQALSTTGRYLQTVLNVLPPDSSLRRHGTTLAAGLQGLATIGGVGAMGYYGGKFIYDTVNSIVGSTKAMSPLVNGGLPLNATEAEIAGHHRDLQNIIMNQSLLPNDEASIQQLVDLLKNRSQLSPTAIENLNLKLSDNVLSLLKKRYLQSVADTVDLKEFTTSAMRNRALSPVGVRPQLVGYPSLLPGMYGDIY